MVRSHNRIVAAIQMQFVVKRHADIPRKDDVEMIVPYHILALGRQAREGVVVAVCRLRNVLGWVGD